MFVCGLQVSLSMAGVSEDVAESCMEVVTAGL